MLWDAIRLAFQTIHRNMLRSILTLLGIVIGVGAVIAMYTIGIGTTEQVKADISKLGTNMISIHPGQEARGPRRPGSEAEALDIDDVEAISDQISGILAVAPAAMGGTMAIVGNENWNTSVWGTTNGFLITRNWTIESGRQFFPSELRAGKSVCIIGKTLRKELFGAEDPIGHKMRLTKISCEIIGLLNEKGQSSVGEDQDDLIIMPLKTVQRRIVGNKDVSMIFVSARSAVQSEKVKTDIIRLMRERRRISVDDEDNFHVRDMAELISTQTGATKVLTGLLSAVATVSLLVGGIGIMNIMLVSVTERTKEIGIRLAIGALEGQVLLQFIVEAVVLSLLGGILGIAFGFGLALIAVQVLNVPFVLDAAIVFVAFAFSAAIGVIFGYFPARRAASLNPIEALRHE